jgi:hypothetical protein
MCLSRWISQCREAKIGQDSFGHSILNKDLFLALVQPRYRTIYSKESKSNICMYLIEKVLGLEHYTHLYIYMPFYLFNWVLNIIYIYIYTYRYIYIFIFIYICIYIYMRFWLAMQGYQPCNRQTQSPQFGSTCGAVHIYKSILWSDRINCQERERYIYIHQ